MSLGVMRPTSPRSLLRETATATLGLVLLLLAAAGCNNVFVPKHRVLVDAIVAPGFDKTANLSYRLIAKKSTVTNTTMQVPVVKACVDAALNGIGMFEAPPNVPPAIFIEVNYGTDTAGRVEPSMRETFVQLSARANADRGIDRGTGPELWDVRVGVLGISGRVESAMPLLCAVAANHIGTDTKMETKLEIPQNSPLIASVRDTAVKTLESKAAPAASPPSPSSAAGSGTAAPMGTK